MNSRPEIRCCGWHRPRPRRPDPFWYGATSGGAVPSSEPQAHELATPRFQRRLQKFVPSVSLLDAAVRDGLIDIFDLPSDTLHQLPQPVGSHPCRSCGGWPKHHVWCPTLGVSNVRVGSHRKNLMRRESSCLPDQTTKSFTENSV